MKEVPTLEGFGCRLRPVEIADAEFIMKLRNQPFAIGKIHSTPLSVEMQEKWIRTWLQRARDYYWIIESLKDGGRPIGTIGLYDIPEDYSEGMPGRLVMLPQVSVSILSPFMLMYRFAFDVLGLQRMVMFVVATNKKVIRFHKLYGAERIEEPERYAGTESEVGTPIVWFGLDRVRWTKMNIEWASALENF